MTFAPRPAWRPGETLNFCVDWTASVWAALVQNNGIRQAEQVQTRLIQSLQPGQDTMSFSDPIMLDWLKQLICREKMTRKKRRREDATSDGA